MPKLTLNKFNHNGTQAEGQRQVELTEEQLAMIVDHAVQLVHIFHTLNLSDQLEIDEDVAMAIDELTQVLDETGGLTDFVVAEDPTEADRIQRERLIAAIMKDDEITDEEYEEIGETPPTE